MPLEAKEDEEDERIMSGTSRIENFPVNPGEKLVKLRSNQEESTKTETDQ